eukprot:EC715967.1.p1 GENE.EC715967.1~~EC715967.1.p1  ORF type:complete len:137 (+),score=8.93 EC715967.1:52-411(+)
MATDLNGITVYLAAPYTHADPAVTEKRVAVFSRTCARLMAQNIFVFSPLHNHLIRQYGPVPGDWEFWQHYSRAFLSRMDKLVVLKLDGWDASVGVRAEIDLATQWCKPIEYMDPHPDDM